MKRSEPQSPSVSFGTLLEKVEIMRSSLRWSESLNRPQIQKLLEQTNSVREEALRLSHAERFVSAMELPRAAAAPGKGSRRQRLLDRQFQFDGVFGDNVRLLEALEVGEKAAPTDLPVLIDGESGTGKELMAKVIHANGNRSEQPLITVNCGAIPENLIESELFGHRKGAFTGATSDRAGKFESADGGTIFLDEIGELPLPGQVKLLRVLQSREVQRVGSDQTTLVDARIIAATNRNLLEMCQAGTFREDLYYRLSIIQVTLPPLRERRDEIPLLIEYFLDEAAQSLGRGSVKLSRRLASFLKSYDYPGNIRELRNLVFRVVCLADGAADLVHLPDNVRPASAGSAAPDTENGLAEPASADSLADAKRQASDVAEREYLKAGLLDTAGNVTELARRLDMNRSHVQALLKKHDLRSKEFKAS